MGSLWGLAKLTVAMRQSVPMAASRVVLKSFRIDFDIMSLITFQLDAEAQTESDRNGN